MNLVGKLSKQVNIQKLKQFFKARQSSNILFKKNK